MWSPNEKIWSPKWENEESNFWHIYSFTMAKAFLSINNCVLSLICFNLKYQIINAFYVKIYH